MHAKLLATNFPHVQNAGKRGNFLQIELDAKSGPISRPNRRARSSRGRGREVRSTVECEARTTASRQARNPVEAKPLYRGKLETQSKPRLRRDAPRGRRAASCYRGQDEMTSGSSASDAVEALPEQARDAVKMPRRFRRDTSVIIEPRAPHVLP